MRKYFKLIAATMVVMIIVGLVPSTSAYAAKEFTYREQNSYTDVTEVKLEVGKKVDLKFIGVSDWRNYNCKWVSSDEKVATVNSAGLVTAVGEGTTTVKLLVGGNESVYASKGVKVIVGKVHERAVLGTSKESIFIEKTLKTGETIDLNAYGLKNWESHNYEYTWVSSNPEVASVSKAGLVTALKAGTTTIDVKIVDKINDKEVDVFPCDIIVTGDVVTPSPTLKPGVSPTPTLRPTATPAPSATPRPTVTPTLTPTPTVSPTPVPTSIPLTFKADLVADNAIKLSFNRPASYSKSSYNITTGYGQWAEALEIESVKYNEDRTVATVCFEDYLTEGITYNVAIKGESYTTTISPRFGVPDRIEVTYTSANEEGKAYAMSDEVYGVDMTTLLGIRIYSGEVDVTHTYDSQGYTTFETVGDVSSEIDFLDTEILFYKTGQSITVNATYSYWNAYGKETVLKSENKQITSKKHPGYKVTGVREWTLVGDKSTENIDWDNPVHSIVAGNEEPYRMVVLLMDNIGNMYSSDDRGVDKGSDIYSINDYDKPFAMNGYYIKFDSSETNQFYVSEDGDVHAFAKMNGAVVKVVLGDNEGRERSLSAATMKLLAPSELSKITPSSTSVTVASNCLPGYESLVCTDEITLSFEDQYGKVWKGEYDLEVTCANKDVQAHLYNTSASPVYLSENVLYVNGKVIREYTDRSSIQFTIKDKISTKSTAITVKLQDPAYDKDGQIMVSTWALDEPRDYDIKLTETDLASMNKLIYVDVFQVSRSNVKVGVQTSQVFVSANPNQTYTAASCSEGDVYISVVGPDGRALNILGNDPYRTGIKVDEATGRVVVVAAAGSQYNPLQLTPLAEGTYTVRATYISSNNGSRVSTVKKTTTFKIVNSTPEVTFRSLKATSTDSYVKDTASIKAVVADLFTFTYDGKEWTEFSVDMINTVDYTLNNNYLTVRSITIAVPYDGKSAGSASYLVKIPNLNKSVKVYTVK